MDRVEFENAIIVISSKYGYEPQSRQLIEEMAELTQAINKFWRKDLECGAKSLSEVPLGGLRAVSIYEEIADVEIVLAQIKHLLNCHNEVELIKVQKIERQLTRMNREG